MEISIEKMIIDDTSAFHMMWQFYQYHQSSFDLEDIGADGRFDIDEDYLNSIIRGEVDCLAYSILISNQIAGFATVEPADIKGTEMTELADLFILPKYRKQGVAEFVIRKLMQTETNQWHLAIYNNDSEAIDFWNNMFSRLNVALVEKIEPPETEGFHEFIITNSFHGQKN